MLRLFIFFSLLFNCTAYADGSSYTKTDNILINKSKSTEKEIEKNYFNAIKNNIKVKIEDITIIDNHNGSSDVLVDVQWSIEKYSHIIDFLQKHINIEPETIKDNYGRIKRVKNPRYFTFSYDKYLKNLSKKYIFDRLISKQILIQIKFDKFITHIPISSGLDYDCCKNGDYKSILSVTSYDIFSKGLPIKFSNIPNRFLKDLNIDTSIVLEKPFFQLIAQNENGYQYDYSLLKNKSIRKYELEEFEWRVSKIEVNAGYTKEKISQKEDLKNSFIDKLNIHKNYWISLKLQELDNNYTNTKTNRQIIYKQADKICDEYIANLDRIIKKAHQRTKKENMDFVVGNHILHYSMRYQ